jgi:hypothetical protein
VQIIPRRAANTAKILRGGVEKGGEHFEYTGEPPYPRIQYPRFQLSAVGRGPKKLWKIKEINGS